MDAATRGRALALPWLIIFGVILASAAAQAQVDPTFITPVSDAQLTSPVLVFEWNVDPSTVSYVMQIQEIDSSGNLVPGAASCVFSFVQADTTSLGGNLRRLTYDLQNPPAFVTAQERQDLITMGSGRFRVILMALQPLTEGQGSTSYTFGRPAPEIRMSAADAADPRNLAFRLLAHDPDNTPDYRYAFTFTPQGGGSPQSFEIISGGESVNQSNLGVANNAAAMGLEQGLTYDLQLVVEDTVSPPAEEGLGQSGVDTEVVRINDLAAITAQPDHLIHHYPNGFAGAVRDVPVPGVSASDLDSTSLDIEADIDYVQGADPADALFTDLSANDAHTLTLQLPTQAPAQPHPVYNLRFRVRDDLGIFGEYSTAFPATLNELPRVVSSGAPTFVNYPFGTEAATVPVPVTLTVSDFESENLRVEVEILNVSASQTVMSQILENVPRNSEVTRDVFLPKTPPENDYVDYQIRLRAIDSTTVSGFTEEAAGEFGAAHAIRLNQGPQPFAVSAPPVVNYVGNPGWIQIPLMLGADDKEPGPLTVIVDARSTEGQLIETINLGQINQGETTQIDLNIAPRAPRRIYDLRVRFADADGAESAETSVQVRLNQPPVIVEHHEPFWTMRYDRAVSDDTIPFDVEVRDDWSSTMTLRFEGSGVDDSFVFGRDFVSQTQRLQGQVHYPGFGMTALTETIVDSDGASESRLITPIEVNDLPQVTFSPAAFRVDVELPGGDPLAEVNLDASVVDQYGGGVTAYSWAFGDGTPDLQQAPPVMHGYDAIGDYQAVLSATDGLGVVGTGSVLVSVNDRPTHSFDIIPAVFEEETNTWRVEQNRPTTFYSHSENLYRDQDEPVVIERDLATSNEPGTKVLETELPPQPGIPHFVDGVEKLTFGELGEFTYAVTTTERFDGETVQRVVQHAIRVEAHIPEVNAANDWEFYD